MKPLVTLNNKFAAHRQPYLSLWKEFLSTIQCCNLSVIHLQVYGKLAENLGKTYEKKYYAIFISNMF